MSQQQLFKDIIEKLKNTQLEGTDASQIIITILQNILGPVMEENKNLKEENKNLKEELETIKNDCDIEQCYRCKNYICESFGFCDICNNPYCCQECWDCYIKAINTPSTIFCCKFHFEYMNENNYDIDDIIKAANRIFNKRNIKNELNTEEKWEQFIKLNTQSNKN